jgi:hypothetical protein
MHNRSTFAFLSLLAGCLLLGCKPAGPPLATVKGKITLEGKPVTAGFVIYQSDDGLINAVVDIDAQGNYEVRTHEAAGIPPGKYKVALKPPAPYAPGTVVLADAGQRDQRPVDTTINQRYHSIETSQLTADVTVEPKSYDFDLKP